MEISPEWEGTIRSVIENPGITCVIGAVDVGKTTFVRQLVSAGAEAGIPTAIVDADTGQSEVGPPTTIGMTTIEHPLEPPFDLHARRMYFTGGTSPVGRLTTTVVGVKRMTDEAIARGSKLIVVDTSGFVTGATGRELKLCKIDLLSPAHVIAIRKGKELDHITSPLARIDRWKLHLVDASPEVRSKPREFRSARRRSKFYEYFKGAERHIIRLDDIACWGTFFTSGKPVKWQHFRTLGRILGARVLHAEVVGTGMYLVADCTPQMAGIEALMKKYGSRDFTVVCGRDYTNLLVGLADANGSVIDLGIIEGIDFRQRHLAVLTPAATITPVRIVQFGAMKVSQDGMELGTVKPGTI